MIRAQIKTKAQFFDLDPMQVVWHGNYAKFLELARCELLDKIGYNYEEMEAGGHVWPIVDLRVKYVRPIRFKQEITVEAILVEYENRLKIDYVIRDSATDAVLTKASTTQVAVEAGSEELVFETPADFQAKVRQCQ